MRLYAPILATLTALAAAAGLAPVPAHTAGVPDDGIAHGTTHGTTHGAARGNTQGGILGRYVLRSVDGVNLPAPIPGEDPRHKISVMDGVLVLNSDGTYICQTIVQTSFMGMVETEADTIRSQYAPIAGSAIVFRVPPKEMDTVATSGAQILWSHPVRRGIGGAKFLYSK
jgi:hypothetical protein